MYRFSFAICVGYAEFWFGVSLRERGTACLVQSAAYQSAKTMLLMSGILCAGALLTRTHSFPSPYAISTIGFSTTAGNLR